MKKDGGASFGRLFQCVDVLRKNSVNPASPLVRVLRGVEKGPFGPELLNSGDDDTRPEFMCGFNKCDGSDIIEVC